MKFLLSIGLVIIIFSCARKEKQEKILPEKKMREVMWDMIRADQYVSDFLLRDTTKRKKDESVKLYDEIFRLHKITADEFKKSLAYYSSRPDLMRPIIDSLATRKNEYPPPGMQRPEKDSLKMKQFHHKLLPKQ
jgi:Domain of unknown function (DUF4296)